MRTLTASDRSALIKLASYLPQGDQTRKAILVGLQTKTAADDKTASDSPKQIGTKIIEAVLADNGDLSRKAEIFKKFSDTDIKKLEQTIADAMEEGLVFDKKVISDIASGDGRSKYKNYENYGPLKKALKKIIDGYFNG